MKSYTNIPLKERKRNADRCYQHEVRAEIRLKEREAEKEACKALAKRSENGI